MQINIPKAAEEIIETIENAGYEAYIVGGCVRDSILGRTPHDWDITTSAQPGEVKALFPRTFDTGIQHGTVSVLIYKEIYEVTTYRIDGKYEDARHPKDVTFTADLKEDLLRRDFTINAMAYNPRSGLVDLYGGLEDIKNRVIRCVGNPHDRFTEDALRIMRAIRFAAQLDYSIEKETAKAIAELAPNLSRISVERIQTELIKTLTSQHPEYINMAYEFGITKLFVPEFDRAMVCEQNNPNHCYTVGVHTLEVLKNTPCDKVLRLAALFHDLGKVETKTTDSKGIDHFNGHPVVSAKIAHRIFRRLKFDNATEDRVCRLVKTHDWSIGAVPSHMRRYMNNIGEDLFPDVFVFNKADLLAQSDYQRQEKMEHLEILRAEYERIVTAKECVSLKTLAVTGDDLLAAGIKEGPEVGRLLSDMLKEVLEDPSKNTKEYLLSTIK